MKNKLSKKILFSLFILAVFSSCVYTQVDGDGNVVKEDRTVSSFTGLDVEDGIDVILTQGSSQSLTIEADKNLHELIKTEVSGGVLKIFMEKNVWNRKTLKAYVTVTDLSSVEVSGGGDVLATGLIEVADLKINVSGGGDLDFKTKGNNVKANISGGGDIEMSADVRGMFVDISGGGDLELDVKAEEMEGSISGGGDAEISLGSKMQSLGMSILGGGDLELEGSIDMIKINISGGGNIDMSSTANELHLDVSGGGNAELTGSANTMIAMLKSGGDLDAEGMKVENAKVTLSGGSDANLNVTGELEVSASGGGNVYVSGNPHIKEGNLSGGSKIHTK